VRPSTSSLLIALALAAALAAQAGWAAATTSGTPDETTYLAAGAAIYQRGDVAPLVRDGVAPLPVLVSTAAPIAAGARDDYPRAIRLARASAILLIAVPLVLIVHGWLLRTAGAATAAAGSALVAFSPNIVGHAGVAATDICFVAAALVALFALARYVERRSAARAALLALAFAAALAAKYSAIALFPALFAVLAATDRDRPPAARVVRAAAPTIGIAAVALLVVWALHGFAMQPANAVPALGSRPIPAAIAGMLSQAAHQRGGHPSFLLGRTSFTGWWYYMPVALALKSTPAELVVIAFALAACGAGWRQLSADALVWRAAIVSFGAFALVNRLDLGVRYVLLLVPLFVFVALERWRRGARPGTWAAACATLVALQIASAAAIAPRYLSYFNRFCGGPAVGYRYLADSNIDWGQDLPALRDEIARLGGGPLLLSYFGNAPFDAYGVTAKRWDANDQRDLARWRWVAISATHLDGLFVPADVFAPFRLVEPSSRAGYSILIYSTGRSEVRDAMAEVARRWRAASAVSTPR
jgi:4-amino-4-deoxy-L-arabinose transferase-like glycosyltransferase